MQFFFPEESVVRIMSWGGIKNLPQGRIYYGSHIAQYIYPERKRVLTTIYGQKVAFLFPQKDFWLFLSLQNENLFPM